MAQSIGDAIHFISLCGPYSQIGLGAGIGYLAGLMLMKVGKCIAMAIGGGIILLEIADHETIVSVDWSKIRSRMADKSIQGPGKSTIDNASEMTSSMSYFSTALIGGTLIGIGCS